jgi:cysteine-rich repeat protein
MQDNDPIRRPCLGGATNTHTRAGEEVCNIDNQLGLVLPMVDTDWMLNLTPPLAQYPATACNNFKAGKSVGTLTCAPRSGSKHSGECPNGDALIGGACSVPVITGVTSQCVSTAATIAPLHKRTVGNSYGRAFNLQMRDGTFTAPTIGYAQYSIPALGVTEDMAAGYNRIHQVETVLADAAAACQLVDMTDQIGCLTASDPCSIGYAGDAAKSWASRPNPAPGGTDAAGFWANDALQVAAVSPNTTTVQKLGLANEYQLSRKLYFGTLVGFGSIPVGGAADPGTDELTLAKYESISTNIVPILNTFSFFGLGPQAALLTGGAADTPFCEDFNEQVICNPTPTSASTLPANANGCANNPAGIPGGAASPGLLTTCSNGTVEVYEECDDGLNNGTTGDKCSATCRCVHDFNNGTGACNP